MKNRLHLVGYCRTSTANQHAEGTVEIQEDKLQEYARRHRYSLVEIFKDEGVSGDLDTREGLTALFQYIDSHTDIDGVMILKLDRLARDLMVQEKIIQDILGRGIRLVSINEPDLEGKDPARVMFRQMLGSIAQYEKAMIVMRLSYGRTHKAKKGGYSGGRVAYGYRVQDGDLVPDSAQMAVIRRIFNLRQRGHRTIREIAQELNNAGIPASRGNHWHPGAVQYILRNQLYRGILSYDKYKSKRPDLAVIR